MDAQAKEIKNKVMCEINSFPIVIFSLMIASLIKQQTGRVLTLGSISV
jgi:hypothetical protein